MSFGFDIRMPRLPRRTGTAPFPLASLPVAGLLVAIDALEREVLRLQRGRLDAGFRRTLALVRQLVGVDAAYWRVAAWNRFVERKRRVVKALERDGAGFRERLLEALGGVAACERWERRAAGLAAFPNRAPREARPEWYWEFKARERAAAEDDKPLSPGSSRGLYREGQTTAAPAQGRGQGILGDEFRLPYLPPATRQSYPARGGARGGTRATSQSLDDMPVPVWPCEVLEGAVHDAVMARVAEAVAEKDAELARQAAAKKTRKGMATRDPRDAGGLRGVRPRAGGGEGERAWAPP